MSFINNTDCYYEGMKLNILHNATDKNIMCAERFLLHVYILVCIYNHSLSETENNSLHIVSYV